MVKLNSVGSILDTKDGIVYPMNADNSADLDCGIHLEDCCQEWFDSLSVEDAKVVGKIK